MAFTPGLAIFIPEFYPALPGLYPALKAFTPLSFVLPRFTYFFTHFTPVSFYPKCYLTYHTKPREGDCPSGTSNLLLFFSYVFYSINNKIGLLHEPVSREERYASGKQIATRHLIRSLHSPTAGLWAPRVPKKKAGHFFC